VWVGYKKWVRPSSKENKYYKQTNKCLLTFRMDLLKFPIFISKFSSVKGNKH
jgi:hypothetical protein